MAEFIRFCPICGQENGCFEECMAEMYLWYLRHCPELLGEDAAERGRAALAERKEEA